MTSKQVEAARRLTHCLMMREIALQNSTDVEVREGWNERVCEAWEKLSYALNELGLIIVSDDDELDISDLPF